MKYIISCRMIIEYQAEIEADGSGVAKWEAMQECRRHGQMVEHEETIVSESQA